MRKMKNGGDVVKHLTPSFQTDNQNNSSYVTSGH